MGFFNITPPTLRAENAQSCKIKVYLAEEEKKLKKKFEAPRFLNSSNSLLISTQLPMRWQDYTNLLVSVTYKKIPCK